MAARGAAAGLNRQHQKSRCAVGWIPAAVAATEPEEHELELDDADLPGVAEAAKLQHSLRAPLSMQQSAEAERVRWSEEWAVGQDLEQPAWLGALDLAPPPPPTLILEHFARALLSFPSGAGLGWGAFHPRALTPLPLGILQAVLKLLALCEAAGRWPEVVQPVIIVLLAKADGGYRPIGLILALPRIWMRARRAVAREWEAA